MAQTVYTNDISDFNVFTRSRILQLAVIHEPENSNLGQGGNQVPYVGVYLQMQAIGSQEDPATGAGRLRIVAIHTNNVPQLLTDSTNPIDTHGAIATAPTWYVVRANGALRSVSAAPTASTTVAASSDAAVRERLGLSPSFTLSKVQYYWTND